MPYPEWRRWRTYFLLEPFGFWQTEAQVARLLSMLFNTHSKKPKKVASFIRKNFHQEVVDSFKTPPDLSSMTETERKRYIREAAMRDLGASDPGKNKRVKKAK